MAEKYKKLESYDDVQASVWYTSDENRQADRTATLNDITTYIYQSLIDYQSKWETTRISSWVLKFPNARYFSVGDKVKNLNTREVYTIESIVDKRSHTVRLSGTTAPVSTHVLELEEENMIDFVSSFPQKQIEPEDWRDSITYKVTRREPGTIEAHPFDGRKEIKPRVRQIIKDPDYPDHHVQILGQWFDNIIQFDCWSVTNDGADSLIDWFEDFMFRYTWVWKKNGVQEILYMSRTIDEEVTKWRDDIVNRTLYYYFRTEKLIPIRETDFTQLDLRLELGSSFYEVPVPSGIPASGITEISDGGLGIV
jgi:hypothetical protein